MVCLLACSAGRSIAYSYTESFKAKAAEYGRTQEAVLETIDSCIAADVLRDA